MKRPIMRVLSAFRVVHIVKLVMIRFVMVHCTMTIIARTVVICVINRDGMDQTSHIFIKRMAVCRRSGDRAETRKGQHKARGDYAFRPDHPVDIAFATFRID